MSKTYQLTKEFLESGDLRLYMAMDTEGEYDIEDFIKHDNLINLDNYGVQPVLSYDKEALAKREELHKRLLLGKPLLLRDQGKPFNAACLYKNKTCVLVGPGKSIDVDAVIALQKAGAVVITLGRASKLIPNADFWVGRGAPEDYPQDTFFSNKTINIINATTSKNNVKHPGTSKETVTKYPDLPSVLTYIPRALISLKTWSKSPEITALGTSTTLGTGLSLAVCLGFTNIILSGMSMSGSLASFYAFKEQISRDVFENKVRAYHNFKEFFPELYAFLAQHAIRVVSLDDSVFDIPSFSEEYLLDALQTVSKCSLFDASYKNETLKPMAALTKSERNHRLAQVNPISIFKAVPLFIEKLPQYFDTEEIEKAYESAKDKLGEGNCPDCTKRRLMTPIYNRFVHAVRTGGEEVQKVWAEALPEFYTMQLDGKLFFRKDKRHLEEDTNG